MLISRLGPFRSSGKQCSRGFRFYFQKRHVALTRRGSGPWRGPSRAAPFQTCRVSNRAGAWNSGYKRPGDVMHPESESHHSKGTSPAPGPQTPALVLKAPPRRPASRAGSDSPLHPSITRALPRRKPIHLAHTEAEPAVMRWRLRADEESAGLAQWIITPSDTLGSRPRSESSVIAHPCRRGRFVLAPVSQRWLLTHVLGCLFFYILTMEHMPGISLFKIDVNSQSCVPGLWWWLHWSSTIALSAPCSLGGDETTGGTWILLPEGSTVLLAVGFELSLSGM